MKKLLVCTATAAALLATYLLVKNYACMNDEESEMTDSKKERHLTTAFSNAKKYVAE